MGTKMSHMTRRGPKQGGVLFEKMLANEISLVDSYKKTSSKCCIDSLRPLDLPGLVRERIRFQKIPGRLICIPYFLMNPN
jgi:hypothetical protein